MGFLPANLSPEMREYYFEEDRTRMSRLLIMGAMLPLVLAIVSTITSFDPMFVVLYNIMLTILIGLTALIAHRTQNYKSLDRFSRVAFLFMVPAFFYLRYTGIIDEVRNDTIAVDFILDMVIIFVSYTALSISPVQKAIGITGYIVAILSIYGTHIGAIPGGVAGLTTVAIAYLAASLLGYGNAALIDKTRFVAYQSLMQEKRLNGELNDKNTEISVTLEKVKVLSGMLPICANCKKIRDDQGYYQQIEHYITEHSEAEFTHGICPDCAKILYPEIDSAPPATS